MAKTSFRIDEAKMQNIGGGSVSSFCERFHIDRNLMYHVRGKAYVKPNTKSAALVQKLIDLGVAKYVNTDRENDIEDVA